MKSNLVSGLLGTVLKPIASMFRVKLAYAQAGVSLLICLWMAIPDIQVDDAELLTLAAGTRVDSAGSLPEGSEHSESFALIREAGEIAEFDYDTLTEEQQAAMDYVDSPDTYDAVDTTPFRKLVDERAAVVDLVDRAMAQEIYDFPALEFIDSDFSHVFTHRHVTTLLRYRAFFHRMDGDLEAELEAVERLAKFAQMVTLNSKSVVGFMVGRAMLAIALHEVLLTLHESEPGIEELERLELVRDLLRIPVPVVCCAIGNEYRTLANSIEALAKGKGLASGEDIWRDALRRVPNPLRKPVRNALFKSSRTKRLIAKEFQRLIETIDKAYVEGSSYSLEYDHLSEIAAGNAVGLILANLLLPAFEDALFKLRCQYKGQLAGLDVALACARHHLDTGSYPSALSALVPKYLDSVPLDPFDGQEMRFDADRGVVYVAGEDLVDNGGEEDERNVVRVFPADSKEAK